MKQIKASELMAMFDETGRYAIWMMARHKPGIAAVVVFENVDLCSSHLGERAAVIVGPTCAFPSVEFCEGKHLNDLPSMRQYPQCWCPVEEVRALPEPAVVHFVVWRKRMRQGLRAWYWTGYTRPSVEFCKEEQHAFRFDSREKAEARAAVLRAAYPEREIVVI